MLTLAVYVHDLNPIAIPLPNVWWLPAGIRWYGISYLLGFLIGYALIRRVTKVGISTIKPAEVSDLVVTLAIGVMIGGRLGYVLFYQPELFGTMSHFPYWGVLAINEGGMASHGGIFGGVVGALWYAKRRRPQTLEEPRAEPKGKRNKSNPAGASASAPAKSEVQNQKSHSWAHILDLAAFATPIGLFFGRIANFINGELYGRPFWKVAPDPAAGVEGVPGSWAVKFPQEMLHTPRIADNVFEAHQPAIEAVAKQFNTTSPAGFEKFIAELIRQIQHGNTAVRDAVAPYLTPRYPSQLIEAVLEGLFVMTMLLIVWRKPRKPLVLGCWFFIAYAAARIVAEIFREPDAQIGYQVFGTTRGQLLSLIPLVVGLFCLFMASRRNVSPMGGWRRVK